MSESRKRMRNYVVEGTVTHELRVDTAGGYEDAAQAFRSLHGAPPQFINDREVNGSCEVCGRVLFSDSAYVEDSEGVKWCKRCPKKRTR